MTLSMKFLIFSLSLCLSVSALGQAHYVLAHPHLNMRNASNRDQVVAKLPYGAEVMPTGRTFESAVIAGLPGTWTEVVWNDADGREVAGVIFDAFVFPAEVPNFFPTSDGDEPDMLEYARSHAGYGTNLGYENCEGMAVSEGVEYGHTSLEIISTTGQALRFFRMWVQASFAPHIESGWMSEMSQKELESGLSEMWDGSQPLFIAPYMEAFQLQWTLERLKPLEDGLHVFVITLEQFSD